MTHPKTVVLTGSQREIAVHREGNEKYVALEVTDTYYGKSVISSVPLDKAKMIGKALIEASGAKFVGSIDTVANHAGGYIRSDWYCVKDTADPDKVQKDIDHLRAVRDKLIEVQKNQKDQAARRRRDQITREVTQDSMRTYDTASSVLKNAIDRIIELEDCAK